MSKLIPLLMAGLFVLLVIPWPGVDAAGPICGKASFYCCQHHGRQTANGERFDQNALTAAMLDRRMLGKTVRVASGGKSVVVRVNDTGGFGKYGRVIDLSRGAFARLASTDAGVIPVCLEVL